MLQSLMFIMSYYPADIRENVLTNTCEFDVLRFKRNDIMCVDYGINKKYCNYNALNREFLVSLEQGVNEQNIVIQPSALWIAFNEHPVKIANFYYNFNCNNDNNETKLLLNIVPVTNHDKSLETEVIDAMFIISILISLYIVLKSSCPVFIDNRFLSGIILCYLSLQYTIYKIYCV